MKPIWIVDDDPSIRFVLEKALGREGWPIRSFTQARDVLAALAEAHGAEPEHLPPQVLLSDIRMPGGSGLEMLEQIKTQHPGLPVIIMTAYSDLDSAVSAFQRGAFEYLPKPFDVPKAVELVRRAVEESQRDEVAEQQLPLQAEMLGQAPAMQDVFRAIGRLSQSNVTVLVTGESGSGKELVARALHRHSPVSGGPFVAINTAAIPKDLLESELFGHERGAFTGAQTQRRGRIEQAEGGSLFLDEIGDMPFDLQTRLLRVLSDGHFYRVGGHQAVKAHVRIIAATHQHLEERVRQGAFREDLFHRLNVIRLRLPALRQRREDIPALTRHFLQQSAQQLGMEPKRMGAEAMAHLQAFAFPGNVRQLENICHWLSVMAPSQVIVTKDLPPEVLEATPPGQLATNSDAAHPAPTLADAKPLLPVSPAPAGTHTDLGSSAHAAGSVTNAQAQHSADTSNTSNTRDTAGTADTAPSQGIQGAHDLPQPANWLELLGQQAAQLLARGDEEVWNTLSREFEAQLIRSALAATHGRRVEAAQRLGIGRNTITRKLQELGLDNEAFD